MTIRNDFPDFGQAPTFLTHNPTVISVSGASTEIARFDTSSYQYGVLYVGHGGTVVDNVLAFEWMGAVGDEADVVMSNTFVRNDNGTIVIPFQALTPTLRLRDIASTVSPYNISVGLTQFTSPPYQHGYPGGIFAINDNRTIVMGDTVNLIPFGCGPGRHSVLIGTDCTDYDVDLTVYIDQNQSITYGLTNATSGTLIGPEIQLPATQWTLDITNNVADTLFATAVYRTPNPT